MQKHQDPTRHYRVVRYFTDFSAGQLNEEIAKDLTLEQAEELALQERGLSPSEDIVIQDQDKIGIEAEILTD